MEERVVDGGPGLAEPGRALAEALCARLPGHVTADEPYYLLEEEGYEFGFPPSLEDYRVLLARSVHILTSSLRPGVIFGRTPLDYLAYLAATGADPSAEASTAALQAAFGSLDWLVITPITPETEQVRDSQNDPDQLWAAGWEIRGIGIAGSADPTDPEGRVRISAAVTGERPGEPLSVVFAVRPDDDGPAARADPPSLGRKMRGERFHIAV